MFAQETLKQKCQEGNGGQEAKDKEERPGSHNLLHENTGMLKIQTLAMATCFNVISNILIYFVDNLTHKIK